MGAFPSNFVLNRTIDSFYAATVTFGSTSNTQRRAVKNGENNGETDGAVDVIGTRVRNCRKSDASQRSDPRVLALPLGPLGPSVDSAAFGKELTRSDRIVSRECTPS